MYNLNRWEGIPAESKKEGCHMISFKDVKRFLGSNTCPYAASSDNGLVIVLWEPSSTSRAFHVITKWDHHTVVKHELVFEDGGSRTWYEQKGAY